LQKLQLPKLLQNPLSPQSRYNIIMRLLDVSKVKGAILLAVFLCYFIFGLAPILAVQNQAERVELEKQLADLEKQIADNETLIDAYKKQGKNLTQEIGVLNAKVSKLNLQIKSITLTLSRLDAEITDNKKEIKTTEENIELNRQALASSLRSVYENDHVTLIAVLLQSRQISDFFGGFNNLMAVQDNLLVAVNKITNLRDKLLEETEALALKRKDQIALKAYQDSQKTTLLSTKGEKDALLNITKGQESRYQELLKSNKKTASQIRSRLFELLGGGSLSFEQAYEFAKFAEQATGVRAALILSVLERESLLGQNVGRCNYKTAMSPGVPPKPGKRDDISLFLALTAQLGINPETITVSCANSDGAYGGAMGPAQFIPSTWNLYKNRVSEITGNNPASPWNNGDAFMATGLYLKDASKGCDAIYSRQTDIERCAAAKYYAGGRWRNHLWGYGDRVATRANQLQADIDILNS